MQEQTIANYLYDAVGNRTFVDLGVNANTSYQYEEDDPRYRLETITHFLSALETVSFGYTRDDVGNPLSFEDHTGTWNYGYDSMNRLTSATPPEGAIPAQAGGPYNYDWVGNRLNPPADPNPMIYNAADQLTLWPGMHRYLYDGNGALTHVKTADGSVVHQSFTYHPTGLMNIATFQGGTIANVWDADEHRVKFTTGGHEYRFIFDPTAGIPAVLVEQTPGDHISYFREPGGELIAMSHPSFGLRYYHFDELGSTRLITDEYGEITDRFTYDAYGAVLSHDRHTGSVSQPYQYVGRLGYYTHYMQPEFGWLQLGVRFYEPEMGRFERRDPIPRIFADAYAYANGEPTDRTDPSGKESQERCNMIERLLNCERLFGTRACACRYSNTFGAFYFGRGLGNVFDGDAPVNTAYGWIDLDWWTDMSCTHHSVYFPAKCFWHLLRPERRWPWQDLHGLRAWYTQMMTGPSYLSLFPPYIFNNMCPNNRRRGLLDYIRNPFVRY